jgi:putative ABC transport system permease protein
LVTEHAVHSLGLQLQPAGWFIQASGPLTAAEITNARAAATTGNFSIETKNDAPSSSEITNWATVFGIALALGVLAMSVGLIRSEARRDLRTLTAAGASAAARRSLTAATAGALALMGALLGTIGAYVAALGWFRSNALNGLSSLASVPWGNLGLIVIGMPLAAVVIGWLIAGRQPSTITLQPME